MREIAIVGEKGVLRKFEIHPRGIGEARKRPWQCLATRKNRKTMTSVSDVQHKY